MKSTLHLLLVLLAGCSAPRPSPVIHIVEETPPPAPAKPWSDGQVATYWIGRSTMGPDGSVIHETHPVYRLEGAGQPQLATPLGSYYPADTPPASTNATYEQYESLRAEAARARDYTLKLTHAAQDLAEQTAQMRHSAETNRLLQIQWGQLIDSAAALSNRVQELEQRLAPLPHPKHP